jgi:hypothetical protein
MLAPFKHNLCLNKVYYRLAGVKPGVVGAEFLTSGSSPPLLQAAIISPAMDRYRTFHFLFFNNFINSDGLALL